MKEVTLKLAEVQAKLHAPKGQKNNFGNYSYRSCEDILTAVKPLLLDASLTLSDTIEMIGNRYYVVATATFKYKGECEIVTAYARESEDKKGMDSAQITGAASSYARKYALNGMFCIDDTKDADSMDNRVAPVDAAKAQQIINNTMIKPAVVPTSIVKAFPEATVVPQTEADFTKAIMAAKTGEALTELYGSWKHFEQSNTPAYNRLLKLTKETKAKL